VESAKRPHDSFDVDDLVVRLHGDMVVMTCRLTPKGQNSEGEASTGHYWFIHVWDKRNERGQVVAVPWTRIPSTQQP
jgi:hypothetical protein